MGHVPDIPYYQLNTKEEKNDMVMYPTSIFFFISFFISFKKKRHFEKKTYFHLLKFKKILGKKSARGFENLWVGRVWANKPFLGPYVMSTSLSPHAIYQHVDLKIKKIKINKK